MDAAQEVSNFSEVVHMRSLRHEWRYLSVREKIVAVAGRTFSVSALTAFAIFIVGMLTIGLFPLDSLGVRIGMGMYFVASVVCLLSASVWSIFSDFLD